MEESFVAALLYYIPLMAAVNEEMISSGGNYVWKRE